MLDWDIQCMKAGRCLEKVIETGVTIKTTGQLYVRVGKLVFA
jgi:hypothetical protein